MIIVIIVAGRILKTLAARGVGLYPALGLPLLAAQQHKPASVSSPSPRSSPANSAPSSPTQKVISTRFLRLRLINVGTTTRHTRTSVCYINK